MEVYTQSGEVIARALVSHLKLVLADEPIAALDKKSGRDVVELTAEIGKGTGLYYGCIPLQANLSM